MNDFQNQLNLAIHQELKTLEDLDAFYHYIETITREMMHRAQKKRTEIEQEKAKLMRSVAELDFPEKPKRTYQRPFLFGNRE
ncbi:MAG TPA: hypothetical protein PLD25_31150 [Chloroflexota bacterium]|nr:hypothetical protein [Chloroflexota bacterium]HUM67886.1 hypothetical protein [Chloroflexota bacterium]